MKKYVLSVAASALMFIACGDDKASGPATPEELCTTAPLLSKGCLEGDWRLVRLELADGSELFDAFDRVGGTLTFKVSEPKNKESKEEFAYNGVVFQTVGYWAISADANAFSSIKCTTGEPDCIPEVTSASAKILGTDTLVVTKNPFENFPTTYGVPSEVYVRQ